jgi:hypothetical protein
MAGFATLKGLLQGGLGTAKAFGKGVANAGRGLYRAGRTVSNPKSWKPGGSLSALDEKTVTQIIQPAVKKPGMYIPAKTAQVRQTAYNVNKDLNVRAARKAAMSSAAMAKTLQPAASNVVKGLREVGHVGLAMARSGPGKSLLRGGFALGATAMFGLSVMKGGMNEAKEIIHERYMQDYTFSRNMLHNSRVGLASGTNRMLDRGGTQGLTLGLSKTRHGRY